LFGRDRKLLLTAQQQLALGLNPDENPDALIERRGFDVYAPTSNPVTDLKEIILIEQGRNIELARGGDEVWEAGKANELRALDRIIHHLDGDLVLLANGDVPALLRRGNRVCLDRKDWFC
jgi:hypothetical protein